MSADTVISALHTVGSPRRLASLARVSVRTAERWWCGETLPGADVLVRLMSKSREVAAVIYKATTTEWQDAEEARLIAQLEALRARRGNDGTTGAVGALARRTLDNFAAAAIGVAADKQDRSGS